jgi:hypothetical protein
MRQRGWGSKQRTRTLTHRVVNRRHVGVLVSGDVEVLFHARDIRIGELHLGQNGWYTSIQYPNQCRCVVAVDSVRGSEALGTHVGLVDVFHQETETQTSEKRAIEL